jgi:glycosyltransferase involved in cell wall biosynthesis
MRIDSILPGQVSVIIPNYNRETLIGETISNLLEQTLPPDEIIVVDDGSTDNSVAVIRSFGEKVKLIQQVNQGPGAARNEGLRMARGEFIQFQDSDDLFSRNKIERQSKLLEQSGADIVFSPWVKVRLDGKRLAFENHVLQQKMPSQRPDLPCWWLRGWCTGFQTALFRRSFLDKIGFFRTDLMLGEDGELFFRVLTSSPKVAFSAEALTLYRLHETNKLTQDEGLALSHRVMDWASCLRHMIERCESIGFEPDLMTRSIFLAGVRKHLTYLQAVPDAPAELKEFLSAQVATLPGLWLSMTHGWLRCTEQMRLWLRGSRWISAYHASAPTAAQLKLIGDLGFQVN